MWHWYMWPVKYRPVIYRISTEPRWWLGRILSTLDTIISSFPIKRWQVSFAKHRVWLAKVSWAAWATRATFDPRLQRHRWCHYRTLSVNKRYFPCVWRRDIHPLPGKPAAECHDVGCCMRLRHPGQFEWLYTGLEARLLAGKCLTKLSDNWMDFLRDSMNKKELCYSQGWINILAHMSAILNLCVFHDGTPSNIN